MQRDLDRQEDAVRALPVRALVALCCLGGCKGDPIPDDGRGMNGQGDGTGGAVDMGAGGKLGLPAPDIATLLDANCLQATQRTSLLPSNVLFVVDRSLSMICNPPPVTPSKACEDGPFLAAPGVPTKWDVTRDALTRAIERLPRETSVGLSYFSNNDSCGVHPEPSVRMAPLAGNHLNALRASLAAVRPAGATPIVGATILAYRHLHELALADVIRGNKFVVLLTDGDQSEECIDEQRCDSKGSCTQLLVEDEAPKAAASGVNIHTFVIGAPGSEGARQTLSQLAVAGGTARPGCDVDAGDCHFDMSATVDFNASLADALSSIAGATTPCEIAVPAAQDDGEVDRDFVNVVYSAGDGSDPRLVGPDDRPCHGEAEGWQYTAEGKKIRLCGSVCDEVLGDESARVDVVFGCKTMGPQ